MTQPVPLYRALRMLRHYHDRRPVHVALRMPGYAKRSLELLGQVRLALDAEMAELHKAACAGTSRCGISVADEVQP